VKKRFEWSPQARSDLKEIEREQAMQILMALTRYGQTGEGDIKHLRGKLSGLRRLRVGDWRVRLQERKGDLIYILAVSHRSEAYR
jgi:mRNA-degrading endonuclease RelE of RelBE toxin-antitoxin system